MYTSTILLSIFGATVIAHPIIDNIATVLLSTAPPEAKAVLKSVKATGTGCPGFNSALFVYQSNATAAFDALIVDVSQADKTKTCVATVDIGLADGWRYTVGKSTRIRGYGEVLAGSSADRAIISTGYTIGSSMSTSALSVSANDLSKGNFAGEAVGKGVSSASGGGVFTLETSLKFNTKGGATGIVTVDSEDIAFEYSKY
ncbi:hypothetical protein BGZ60DRAFT_482723 [Tricladium varicosporioides]|nr:hypothetical protein BGZ60DRAFT_482723 [Hymenoscyphus varicosporioides]